MQGWGNTANRDGLEVSLEDPTAEKKVGCKAVLSILPTQAACAQLAPPGMREEMPGLTEVWCSLHPCPQGPPQRHSKFRCWATGADNLLEKSCWLAPPIPHQPPQSWSLPTEGAPESFSLGMYAALKNTLHSRSALASSGRPTSPPSLRPPYSC